MRRVPVPVLVAALALGLAALHVVWLARFRWGYVTDWDEAGYLSIALLFHDALADGPLAYIDRQPVSGAQPPVVPTSAVPVMAVFGRSVDAAQATIALWSIVLVVATYGVARRLMPPRWALLAAACVGTAPVVADWSRLFHFAVPAAALMTSALWALLASDGLRRTRCVVAAGVLLALMSTARTMTIAYVPAVLAGVGVPLLRRRSPDRGLRVRNLALLVGVAVAVAALWWAPTWDAVWPYLSGSGYGSAAATYGESHSVFSATFWTTELRVAAELLQLPLAAALVVCLGFAAPRVREGLRDEVVLLLCVVAGGYLALSSTRNQGTAFALPWLPALVVLGVGAAAVARGQRTRWALAALLAGVCAWNVALKNGVSETLSETRYVGGRIAIDGRDYVYRSTEAAGYPNRPPPARLPAMHRRWPALDADMARFIDAAVDVPEVGVATGDSMLPDTRLLLATVLHLRRPLAHGLVHDGSEMDGWNVLVTSDRPRRPSYRVGPEAMAAAARSKGFEPARRFRAPDGRTVTVWVHPGRIS